MPTRILPNGKIAVMVVISTPTGARVRIELAADTGSEYTMISPLVVDKLRLLDTSFQSQLGRQIRTGGPGIIAEIFNLKLEADVEDDRTGNVQTRASSRLYVHTLIPAEAYFEGTQGLLGMDSFDAFGADPVKDQAGTRAYLRKRQ